MADCLNVLMGGRVAGSLIRRGRSLVLEYDEVYMAAPDAHPLSLSLPLERCRHAGDAVGNWLAAPDALADAAHDLPSGVRSSPEVNALATLGARRAEACLRIIRHR